MTTAQIVALVLAGLELSSKAATLLQKVNSGELDPATITPDMLKAPSIEEIMAKVDASTA